MEAVTKNKRGRPKTIGQDYSAFRFLCPGLTDRQVANFIYSIKGLRILNQPDETGEVKLGNWKDPIYEWLKTKTGILSELGRLSELVSDDYILEIARQVCEMKPKTREGEKILRQHRLKLMREIR